jgi:hemolysin activation/secretion protein
VKRVSGAAAHALAFALLFAAAAARAQEPQAPRERGSPELMQALAQGGYVIYFRHGHTHWQQKLIEQGMQAEGRHDLGNCATQRNLDAIGRADARQIHAALLAARIPVGQVLASLYCRPAEYVALITGRAPVRTRWLTGLSTPETLLEIKREVATPPAPGTNTFLSGHGDRPFDLTGLVIQEGDALVFDPRNHETGAPGKFKPVAWIKPAEWAALAGVAVAPSSSAPVIADVNVRNAPFHDAANVRASLPILQRGARLDDAAETALARSVQLARESPSRNVEVLFTPAATPGEVNADVAVASRRPWAVMAGLNHADAGASALPVRRDRAWLGTEHSNLWNLDHQAALQVSDASGSASRNASLAYRAPWPQRGVMVGAVATRAQEGAGLDAELQPVTGSGRMVTLYARAHLVPQGDYHHQLQLALGDRSWFDDSSATPGVRSRPLELGYAAHWEQEWIGWKFATAWALNLPGGADNDAAHYALANPNASRNWNALRLNAQWLRILTYDIRLRLSGRAQWSNDALIAGEQFALGGALQPWGSSFGVWSRAPWIGRDGVRGLAERAAPGDSGAQASAELWSRRLYGQDLRVGGFVDAGSVHRVGPADNASASSVGLLGHWQLRGQVALSSSAAHVLRGAGSVGDHSNHFDLTLLLRY